MPVAHAFAMEFGGALVAGRELLSAEGEIHECVKGSGGVTRALQELQFGIDNSNPSLSPMLKQFTVIIPLSITLHEMLLESTSCAREQGMHAMVNATAALCGWPVWHYVSTL